MPIAADRIKTPDVIEATPDERLGRVRDRLAALGERKWRAWVLVREGGQAAPVPVDELRRVAWQQGPAALDRPLRDLGILSWQPGVEMDQVSAGEADRLAWQLGGRLIILRGGAYAGLVLSGPPRVQDQPDDAFDLFDERLAAPPPGQLPALPATPDTTLAQVARLLRALPEGQRRSACVVAGAGGEPLLVMAVRELDSLLAQEAAARGPLAAWSLTLRDFAPEMRPAVAQEMGALGLMQAQALADRHGALVITRMGAPQGVLLSHAVRRRAVSDEESFSVPDEESFSVPGPGRAAPRGAAPGLFDIPLAQIESVPGQLGPRPPSPAPGPAPAAEPPEPRVANLWFADKSLRPLPADQPLVAGRPCVLAVNIGRQRAGSLAARDPNQPAILEPPPESPTGTPLYVHVFSDDEWFRVDNPSQQLLLPPGGDSPVVLFGVTPLRRTFDSAATLDVQITYRCNLVQAWQVRAEIVAPGAPAAGSRPQTATLVATRTTDYAALDALLPRQVSLAIHKGTDGAYRFDVVVGPGDPAGGASTDEIRLGCRVVLRPDDLGHLINKARRQLYNITRADAFQQAVASDPATSLKALRALALVGRQLYHRLFEAGGPTGSAAQVAAWIRSNVPEGSTVQIVDHSGEFVFPWSLVYDGVPWQDGELANPVDVQCFWGWRYRIELLTPRLIETYAASSVEIDPPRPVRVAAGFYDRLPRARENRALFAAWKQALDGRAAFELFDTGPKLTALLEAGDRDVLYVFCHGFTEKMAADLDLADDLLGEFRGWLRTLPRETRQAYADREDDLFNVADSWLSLTYGQVPLTMMEYYATPSFAAQPLVFLNMCESAQVLPSLSGGFVPFFLDRGSRAVIGTECPMTSTFAHAFASEFFTRFFSGQPVGAILWDLRRHFLSLGNPLGLAYTLYGDAGVRLKAAILSPA